MASALLISVVLMLGGCYKQDRRETSNDAARKVGQAAYQASHEAEKAAKDLGHQLDEASREAQKGWEDAKRQDREKKAQQDQERDQ